MEQLWCIHVEGPDDIFPMPSKTEAEKEAVAINLIAAKDMEAHGDDIMFRAVVIPYPYSAESHAEGCAERAEEQKLSKLQPDTLRLMFKDLNAEVDKLATERVKLKGDVDALDTALSHYKKKYLGARTQVGQISHLSEIVCTWALEHTNLGEESPEVLEAAAQLMEWFDQDRIPNHDFFSKESEKMLAEAVQP